VQRVAPAVRKTLNRPLSNLYTGGLPMQNEMPVTIAGLKSKPEVEFQYGGRSFSQTGSSCNSAVD